MNFVNNEEFLVPNDFVVRNFYIILMQNIIMYILKKQFTIFVLSNYSKKYNYVLLLLIYYHNNAKMET